MEYIYKTENTCSRRIKFNIDGDVITKVEFLDGGCPGNLQALPRLVEGMTVSQIEEKLSGIMCGTKNTSCADQLAKAVRKALDEIKKSTI